MLHFVRQVLSLHPVLLLSVLLLLALSACSVTTSSDTGFLGDPGVYAQLKPHPKIEGIKVFRKNDTPLAGYESFILPLVKVYQSKNKHNGIAKESELAELAQYFRTAVHEALDTRYRITNVPGPKVGVLRLAISEATLYPAASTADGGRRKMRGELSSARIEIELLDSLTGERIAAAVAGKTLTSSSAASHLDGVKEILTDWAKLIRRRIDEDHGFA